MDEALKKSGDYPNIALTPGTNRHAATGEAVEIPASARMDGGTCDIPKTCTLKPLTPFATALMGIFEPEWGVCSECGSATPKVGSYCAICGAHVVKVVDE